MLKKFCYVYFLIAFNFGGLLQYLKSNTTANYPNHLFHKLSTVIVNTNSVLCTEVTILLCLHFITFIDVITHLLLLSSCNKHLTFSKTSFKTL
jgi:hypothetical protein